MGWFDRQIRDRRQQERVELAHAYWSLASVINKRSDKTFSEEYDTDEKNALIKICDYYHIECNFLKEESETLEGQLERLQNTVGLISRQVVLKGKWWKDMDLPFIAERKDGQVIAVFPDQHGHCCYETKDGRTVKINSANGAEIGENVVCFYPPLKQSELKPKDVFVFLWKCISVRDKWKLAFAGFMASLLGMITPLMTQLLFAQIIPSGQLQMIYSVGGLLVGTAVAVFLFGVIQNMLLAGIQYKMETALSAAVFHRVLNLPASFFKQYSSGELAERILCLNQVCGVFCANLLGAGMTVVFSTMYLVQIFGIERRLVLPALCVLFAQIVIAGLGMFGQIEYLRKKLYAGTKVQSMVFSLLNGIQKIKVTGCEKRAFAKWMQCYRKEADASYNPPLFLKMKNVLAPTIAIFGTFLIYLISLKQNIQISQYMAFNTAFGMVSTSILSLTAGVTALSTIRPIFELAKPVLETEPEVSLQKEVLHNLIGSVELNNVTFQYTEDGPKILDNINLKIKPGQYVAIVGKTGCGKSTLMRLLLGFETPNTGAVYYDGKDVSKLDQKSLHRQIGVVMQNGRLFGGSIYSNITVSAPQLTLDEAWEAARMAGIEEDIKKMPMGMHTVLSEGAGGISGGQKQRLMIARAIASKPKILLLDEATSALDNITQKQVSNSLNGMRCTRIVIAHRLSTIRECDRILVLDHGKIIEDGTYETLAAQNGFFAELVRRQQL